MNYVIEGLEPANFMPLFAHSDAELARHHILPVTASDDDYPCRITLCGAAKGDRLLLLNYQHQPAASPYRSSHAIYVAQGSVERGVYCNMIPPVMLTRILSIRAFDAMDLIIDAEIVDGVAADSAIQRLLALPETTYLHVHFAKRGCFAATVRKV